MRKIILPLIVSKTSELRELTVWELLSSHLLGMLFIKMRWILSNPFFLLESPSLHGINHTRILLIPKFNWPISLCNEIYKIISKLLGKRFKVVLEKWVTHEQNAFLPGRQIVDNVVLISECIRTIWNKQTKRKWCATKLDMSKSFRQRWVSLSLQYHEIMWICLTDGVLWLELVCNL